MNKEEIYGLMKQRRIARDRCKEKDKEIERLNNIIDELEKWLKENIGICRTNINYTTNQIFNLKEDTYYRCLNKLKELKGENNDI